MGEEDQTWGGFGSSSKDNTKPRGACAGGPIAVREVQKVSLTGGQRAHCWIGSIPPLSSERRSTLRNIFRSTCMDKQPLYLSPPSVGSSDLQQVIGAFFQAFIKSLSWQRHPCSYLGSWHSAQAPELPAWAVPMPGSGCSMKAGCCIRVMQPAGPNCCGVFHLL